MESALEEDDDVEGSPLENYTVVGKSLEDFGKTEKSGTLELEMEMNCTNSCNQSATVQVFYSQIILDEDKFESKLY